MDVWVLEKHVDRRPWYEPQVIGTYGAPECGMAFASPEITRRQCDLDEDIALVEQVLANGGSKTYAYEGDVGRVVRGEWNTGVPAKTTLRVLMQERRRLDFWEAHDEDHLTLALNPDDPEAPRFTLTRHLLVG